MRKSANSRSSACVEIGVDTGEDGVEVGHGVSSENAEPMAHRLPWGPPSSSHGRGG
jgi:hypothetical protein